MSIPSSHRMRPISMRAWSPHKPRRSPSFKQGSAPFGRLCGVSRLRTVVYRHSPVQLSNRMAPPAHLPHKRPPAVRICMRMGRACSKTMGPGRWELSARRSGQGNCQCRRQRRQMAVRTRVLPLALAQGCSSESRSSRRVMRHLLIRIRRRPSQLRHTIKTT